MNLPLLADTSAWGSFLLTLSQPLVAAERAEIGWLPFVDIVAF